jgi:hypothetical protein
MLPRLALGLCLALAFAAAAVPAPLRADDADSDAALCEQAIVAGARRGGVPPEVLHAIALTETGRKAGGRVRPYPWAINREGKGHWFKSREEALAFAEQSLAAGRRSFDVGCVQINFRWHGHAFPSLDDMFDPEWTATYAAQFLRTLYEERGSWSAAAGAYHSLTPELAQIYRARFDRLLAGLDPAALHEAAAVAAMAPQAAPGRIGRRAASRQAMVDAIRQARLAPPPEPVMGSVAAGPLIAPPGGSLLVQGSTLLTEGAPLLSGPSGSLF